MSALWWAVTLLVAAVLGTFVLLVRAEHRITRLERSRRVDPVVVGRKVAAAIAAFEPITDEDVERTAHQLARSKELLRRARALNARRQGATGSASRERGLDLSKTAVDPLNDHERGLDHVSEVLGFGGVVTHDASLSVERDTGDPSRVGGAAQLVPGAAGVPTVGETSDTRRATSPVARVRAFFGLLADRHPSMVILAGLAGLYALMRLVVAVTGIPMEG